MKTLNNLLNENKQTNDHEQPINESVALIAGLFGALALGIGALFKAAKGSWDEAGEPSEEDEQKAKDNEKNMDDSTKAAYTNVLDELDDTQDNISDDQKELFDDEEKSDDEKLEIYIKHAKRSVEEDSDDDIKNNPAIYVKICDTLRKLSEKLDNKDGKELSKKLKDKLEKIIGKDGIEKARLGEKSYRVKRCYLSQIAINASKAYDEEKQIIGNLKDLLEGAVNAAKEKLDKDSTDNADDISGSDLGKQTMISYVIKVAVGLSAESLENDMFLKMIDDVQFVSVIEILISASMIINANQYKTEQLEIYQKMFNTLGLKIQLSGK